MTATDASLRYIDSDGHILEHPTGMLDFAPEKFRAEESAPLAVILTFRGGKDKLICRPHQAGQLNAQPTFFKCLSDGGLRGRLGTVLTTARQEETSRSRDDSDFVS